MTVTCDFKTWIKKLHRHSVWRFRTGEFCALCWQIVNFVSADDTFGSNFRPPTQTLLSLHTKSVYKLVKTVELCFIS